MPHGSLYMLQAREQTAILSNVYGSQRYMRLLQGLGCLLRLADCSAEDTYLGGLDQGGNDGQFAVVWQEEFIQGQCRLKGVCCLTYKASVMA